MSIISSIRNRSGFLVIVIAFALLSFVVSGLVSSIGRPSQGGIVGEVNGADVLYPDFAQRVSALEYTYAQKGLYVVLQAWDRVKREVLLGQNFDSLGIVSTSEELIDIMSQQYATNPNFRDESGKFDKSKLIQNIKDLQQYDPSRWARLSRDVDFSIKSRTYQSLVNASLRNENVLEEDLNQDFGRELSVSYIYKPYEPLKEEYETQLLDRYIQHYGSFLKESVHEASLSYVLFKEEPSEEDRQEVLQALESLKAPFTRVKMFCDGIDSCTDVEQFVVSNSSGIYEGALFLPKDKLPNFIKKTFSDFSIGQVVGPYEKDQAMYLSKYVDSKEVALSASATQILIEFGEKRSKDEAKGLADSLFTELKSTPSKLKDFVAKFSDDAETKSKGGVLPISGGYTALKEGEVKDFIFDLKQPELGIVEGDAGYHILDVSREGKQTVYWFAHIERDLLPSEVTQQEVYRELFSFEKKVEQLGFSEAAKQMGLEVFDADNLTDRDERIPGVSTPVRPIVRWLFSEEPEKGSIKRFNIDGGYLLVQVTSPSRLKRPSSKEIDQRSRKNIFWTDENFQIVKANDQKEGTFTTKGLKEDYLDGIGSDRVLLGAVLTLKNVGKKSKVHGLMGEFNIELQKVEQEASSSVSSPLGIYDEAKIVAALESKYKVMSYVYRYY